MMSSFGHDIAIDILAQNIDCVYWRNISYNKNIFELDLAFLKARMDVLREEMMMVVFHPKRVERYFYEHGYSILEDETVEDIGK